MARSAVVVFRTAAIHIGTTIIVNKLQLLRCLLFKMDGSRAGIEFLFCRYRKIQKLMVSTTSMRVGKGYLGTAHISKINK